KTSPIFNYPYARSRDSLDKLAQDQAPDPCHGWKMQFMNPLTGGHAMPTIAAFIQLLPKGFRSQAYRSTDGTIYSVVEGEGRVHGTMICYLERRYGDMPGETLDLFPARKGDGSCMLFIHGGYWRSLDKRDFSFLAPAWVDAGVSLAVVNYDLCPKVTMEEIVRQMLRASRWLWLHAEEYGMDQDRLYVCGHSAGGHLTAMMMSALWPVFDARLPKDLWKGWLAIS